MSVITSKFSYKKLKNDFIYDAEDQQRELVLRRSRISWAKKLKNLNLRRKFRIKIRVSKLRKFIFRRRRKPKVQLSWAKVMRRLKDSQAHFGDLFAGNYLFMQVTPGSLKGANTGNEKYKIDPKVIMGTQGRLMGADHLHGLFGNYGLGKAN